MYPLYTFFATNREIPCLMVENNFDVSLSLSKLFSLKPAVLHKIHIQKIDTPRPKKVYWFLSTDYLHLQIGLLRLGPERLTRLLDAQLLRLYSWELSNSEDANLHDHL